MAELPAKGDDIQERLIDFAVEIIDVCCRLPSTPAGNHVAGQLVRSGTAGAPNYGEARGAESRRDFLHKLGIVQKELNESMVWLRIIRKSRHLKSASVDPVISECDQLCRIIGASIRTAQRGSVRA